MPVYDARGGFDAATAARYFGAGVERRPDAVVVGYLHGDNVAGRFHQSLVDMIVYDSGHLRRTVFGGGGVMELESGPNLALGRNNLVERFLTSSTAPWLLMLDTDMTFEMNLIEALLAYADPVKAPIVGGLCFSVGTDGVLATLYDLDGSQERPQPVRYLEWPENALFPVFATGAACLLVHRSVLEAIRDYRDPEVPDRRGFSEAFPWFMESEFFGRAMSEDITFCLRAHVVGFPVHVATGVKLGHVKKLVIGAEHYRRPAPSTPPTAPEPAPTQFSARTRERLVGLASHARQTLAPEVVAAHVTEPLTWIYRDGGVVIMWGDFPLVTLDREGFDAVQNDDYLTVRLGELPEVPDDIADLDDVA